MQRIQISGIQAVSGKVLAAVLVFASVVVPVSGWAARRETPSQERSVAGSGGETSKDEAPFGASLAFHLGLGGEFSRDGHNSSASPTLGVTPVLERRLGSNFAFGFEWMFLWVKDTGSDRSEARSKLWAPQVRARISFPVWEKLRVGAMLGLGLGLFFAPKDDGDFNLGLPSYRFGFGGDYPINDQVRVFADLGYMGISYKGLIPSTKTLGQTEEVDSSFGTVLFTSGLMAMF
jgi:hypothetical protein